MALIVDISTHDGGFKISRLSVNDSRFALSLLVFCGLTFRNKIEMSIFERLNCHLKFENFDSEKVT